MRDLEAIADRVEIEALRGEFTDAVMMRDYDRLAALFTPDGAVRMPHIGAEATSRAEIRAAVERLQALWDCFVQNTHAGTIEIDGDAASGRAYIAELMHGRGSSHLNHALYHDRYERTPNGWKFTERVYEVRYVDTSPLAGSADLPLPVGLWRIDPERSEVGFAVEEMWGLRTVRGVFGAYDGSLKVRAGGAEAELTVEAGSLDTGNDRRDRQLRSADFFDVERHPRIVFSATAAAARDGGLTLTGELAIGSSRVRLEIPVDVEEMAGGALRVEGETTVSRTAAGLDWNMLGMIRDDAVLHARLTLVREDSNAGE